MPITALYAALLTAMLVVLTFRVVVERRAKRVEIGDGADRELLRRMRVHANFIETVPYSLILLGLAESLAAAPAILHGLGATLVFGRLIHAWGLSQTPHVLQARVAGMALTLTVVIVAALVCLYLASGRLAIG